MITAEKLKDMNYTPNDKPTFSVRGLMVVYSGAMHTVLDGAINHKYDGVFKNDDMYCGAVIALDMLMDGLIKCDLAMQEDEKDAD